MRNREETKPPDAENLFQEFLHATSIPKPAPPIPQHFGLSRPWVRYCSKTTCFCSFWCCEFKKQFCRLYIPILKIQLSQRVSIHAERLRSPHSGMRFGPFGGCLNNPHFQEARQGSGRGWRSGFSNGKFGRECLGRTRWNGCVQKLTPAP